MFLILGNPKEKDDKTQQKYLGESINIPGIEILEIIQVYYSLQLLSYFLTKLFTY